MLDAVRGVAVASGYPHASGHVARPVRHRREPGYGRVAPLSPTEPASTSPLICSERSRAALPLRRNRAPGRRRQHRFGDATLDPGSVGRNDLEFRTAGRVPSAPGRHPRGLR